MFQDSDTGTARLHLAVLWPVTGPILAGLVVTLVGASSSAWFRHRGLIMLDLVHLHTRDFDSQIEEGELYGGLWYGCFCGNEGERNVSSVDHLSPSASLSQGSLLCGGGGVIACGDLAANSSLPVSHILDQGWLWAVRLLVCVTLALFLVTVVTGLLLAWVSSEHRRRHVLASIIASISLLQALLLSVSLVVYLICIPTLNYDVDDGSSAMDDSLISWKDAAWSYSLCWVGVFFLFVSSCVYTWIAVHSRRVWAVTHNRSSDTARGDRGTDRDNFMTNNSAATAGYGRVSAGTRNGRSSRSRHCYQSLLSNDSTSSTNLEEGLSANIYAINKNFSFHSD